MSERRTQEQMEAAIFDAWPERKPPPAVVSEINAAELARLRMKFETQGSGSFYRAELRALLDALEARDGRETAQNIEVTEEICFDRMVRERDSALGSVMLLHGELGAVQAERDSARALLRDVANHCLIPGALCARIAKELGQ